MGNRVHQEDKDVLKGTAYIRSNTVKDGSGTDLAPLLDSDGHQQVDVVSGGTAGVQYTEGDIDASITGTAALAEGPSNTLTPIQVDASKLLQVDIAADSVGIGGGTQYADGAARGTATGTIAMGDDGTNIQSLKCDANGVLAIQDNAGAITVDGTVAVTNANITSIDGKMVSGTDIGDVTINNAAGAAAVNIQDGGNAITVDGSVTASIAAAQTLTTVTTVGAVTAITNVVHVDDNASTLSVDGTVTAAQATAANLNCTEASASAIKTAAEVIDNCISGNEAQVDVVAALPTGTNIIGAVKRDVVNYTKVYKYVALANTNETTVWDPTAGTKFVITDIFVSATAAGTCTLKDGTAGTTFLIASLAANGGFVTNLQTPIQSTTADNNLTATAGAATQYVLVCGYEV